MLIIGAIPTPTATRVSDFITAVRLDNMISLVSKMCDDNDSASADDGNDVIFGFLIN